MYITQKQFTTMISKKFAAVSDFSLAGTAGIGQGSAERGLLSESIETLSDLWILAKIEETLHEEDITNGDVCRCNDTTMVSRRS